MSKLWGGRFSKKTNPLVEEFTKSIGFDYKLGHYDVLCSLAHIRVLRDAGYLTTHEFLKLRNGLKKVKIGINPQAEDIHTAIQNNLKKKIGDLVSKLQTARSRN